MSLRLLINEGPFPGERGWESEADSKDAMRQVLLVLDARLNHIPPRYTQTQIAAVKTDDIIVLMTAGGVHGQPWTASISTRQAIRRLSRASSPGLTT